MNALLLVVGLGLSLGLFAYLAYVMAHPERF